MLFAVFRFDCGSGAGRVTTTNSILLGQWNTIEIHRNEQAGYVRLNDGPLAKGWSKVRETLRQSVGHSLYRTKKRT